MGQAKENNNNEVITSNELLNKNCIVLPEKAKDFSNNSFWYYTCIDTADKILANKCIYVSNLVGMNDLDEAQLHEKDKEFVHCWCFCNSNTEKIPMWYLYSGITGQGVSLGFTPSVMLELIKSIHTVTTPDKKTILYKDNNDFDLDYGWIFYQKKENPSSIMFKRKWYSLKDPQNFEKNNFFIKSYPWEYEKEFRIVIHNKTGKPYDKLVIDIDSIYSKIKLKLAPELSNQTFNNMLPNLPGFASFFSNIPLQSNLSINMNLCERNFEGFVDFLKINSNIQSNIKLDYDKLFEAFIIFLKANSNIENNTKFDYSKICEAISHYCKNKGEK